MGKNKNKNFSNVAAKKFSDIQKVDLMGQGEIYRILDSDYPKIVEQYHAYLEHKGPYPSYVGNMFANIATVLWFKEYIKEHTGKPDSSKKLKTDLPAEEIEVLRSIIADIYKKSATNFYSQQIQEFAERNKMLLKMFIRLSPEDYRLAEKFEGLNDSQIRELVIQAYTDPVYSMKYIHKILNKSTISDKEKIKLLKKMMGKKKFKRAVGAALTVEGNNSDSLAMFYDYVMSKSKQKRAKYILWYAEAYKRNKTRFFRVDQQFYEQNESLIDQLVKIDLGYKKAFRNLKGGKSEIERTKMKY